MTTDPTGRQWVLTLPWSAPPLSMNDRGGWRGRAPKIAQVRADVLTLARAAKVPPLGRCEVLLTWHPMDRRHRDADNPAATLKVCCDALVDAGIVPDDVPRFMRKLMPVLGPVVKGGRVTLTITEIHPTEGAP